jgi:predicted RNA-binding Zn-ribbon protein involved in translation (DUF1610 family)
MEEIMEIQKINCASCGAPIDIPENIDKIKCPFCTAQLSVNRGERYITLQIVEKVSNAVERSGNATQTTIRDSTQVTQTELKRLQISQDLSMLQLQLTNIQSEIRSLERGKRDLIGNKQINDLFIEEKSIKYRMQLLQKALLPVEDISPFSNKQIENMEEQFPNILEEELSIPASFLKINKKPYLLPRVNTIWIGIPSILIGILVLLDFIFAQIGNTDGISSNLTGFIGSLILCAGPFIIFGIILTIYGIIKSITSKNVKIEEDNPSQRRYLLGLNPIWLGTPLFVCGILFVLLMTTSQIGNEKGILDNLVGYIGTLFLCSGPLIILGITMILNGLVNISNRKSIK